MEQPDPKCSQREPASHVPARLMQQQQQPVLRVPSSPAQPTDCFSRPQGEGRSIGDKGSPPPSRAPPAQRGDWLEVGRGAVLMTHAPPPSRSAREARAPSLWGWRGRIRPGALSGGAGWGCACRVLNQAASEPALRTRQQLLQTSHARPAELQLARLARPLAAARTTRDTAGAAARTANSRGLSRFPGHQLAPEAPPPPGMDLAPGGERQLGPRWALLRRPAAARPVAHTASPQGAGLEGLV